MRLIFKSFILWIFLSASYVSMQAQEDDGKEAILEECENVSAIFDELAYYELEFQEIRKRKTKGFYSKDDYPYEMLDLSFRKYVKKNITKVDFNYFTQTMKAVDNYLAGIENRFNRQLLNEKSGMDNKAEQARFQDAKKGATAAFLEEKSRLGVDCSTPTKESKKKKKKKK